MRYACRLSAAGGTEGPLADRNILLESALDKIPDGVAVFDSDDEVVFWNAAAEAITGYATSELQATTLPSGLKPLIQYEPQNPIATQSTPGTLVRIRHKLGQQVSAIVRCIPLHSRSSEVIGTALLFHPSGRLDAMPRGETGDDQSVVTSQAEFEERLSAEFEDFERGEEPVGVLWVSVDQAYDLRRTHGVAACRAMFEKIQRTLISGLRPAEELGRWGEDEFLILMHERTNDLLTRRAHTLAGLARTADFRWWGDRISLTVSIGAAQAVFKQPPSVLLDRAKKAMETSIRAGGNCVTCAPRETNDNASGGDESICTPS